MDENERREVGFVFSHGPLYDSGNDDVVLAHALLKGYAAQGDLPRRVFLTGDLEREAHKAVARLLARAARRVRLEAAGGLDEALLLHTLRHLFDPDTDRANELQGRYLK